MCIAASSLPSASPTLAGKVGYANFALCKTRATQIMRAAANYASKVLDRANYARDI